MHQERYLSLLLTFSALDVPISVVGLILDLNTSIQPYDKDLAFRRCSWTFESNVGCSRSVCEKVTHRMRGILEVEG